MEKDMAGTMITGKPEIFDTKRAIFQPLVGLINRKIGRWIDQIEKEAIAFVVEELFQEPTTAESFLTTAFGVEEKDTGRETAIKVHNAVYEAKMRKINTLIGENPLDAGRLKEMRITIDIGHNQTLENYHKPDGKVYIGGVSSEWLPSWFSTPSPSVGQER